MQITAAPKAAKPISEEDQLRVQLYKLLGALLAREPNPETLQIIRNLQGDDSDFGKAFQQLAGQADKFNQKTITQEFNALFIGMGRGELVPYGSYYLTGFLNEKPLAKLRNSMRDLGITRADDVKEPEDNIGSLMEMMAGLIEGLFTEPADQQTQMQFFQQHIGNWAPHFFKDLEKAEMAHFYRPVGAIGRMFMEIEEAQFAMDGEGGPRS